MLTQAPGIGSLLRMDETETILHIKNEDQSITFSSGHKERLKITPDGFFIDGQSVDIGNRDEHNMKVYQTFKDWMTMVATQAHVDLEAIEDLEIEKRGFYLRFSCAPEDIKDDSTRVFARRVLSAIRS